MGSGACVRALSVTPPTSGSDSSPVKDWQLGRLNHVAIAVPDLDKAARLYRDVLGATVSDVVVSAYMSSIDSMYIPAPF